MCLPPILEEMPCWQLTSSCLNEACPAQSLLCGKSSVPRHEGSMPGKGSRVLGQKQTLSLRVRHLQSVAADPLPCLAVGVPGSSLLLPSPGFDLNAEVRVLGLDAKP